jgi:hypothetical protein
MIRENVDSARQQGYESTVKVYDQQLRDFRKDNARALAQEQQQGTTNGQ